MNAPEKIGNVIFLIGAVLLFVLLFDELLFLGLFLLFSLSILTILFLYKKKIASRLLILLIAIVFLVHLSATLAIHYAHFQPFGDGGGDFSLYDREAKDILQLFKQGDLFSSKVSYHSYSFVVASVYFMTSSQMLGGELFNVWLVLISIICVFLIVKEIGGSDKQAFAAGLVANFYPSLLFYGSLLIKDAVIVCVCMLWLILTIKLIKSFSWAKFLILYALLAVIINFRVYVGLAAVATFIFCWQLLSKVKMRKRVVYSIIMAVLIGFLFQVSGYGYYGINIARSYIHKIDFYQNYAYSNESELSTGSTVKFENYLESFTSTVLGPFPWHIKYKRQMVILAETFSWYVLFFFICKAVVKNLKRNKMFIPLIIFSFLVFSVLAIFVNNFGITSRIRMPAFLALLCLMPFGLDLEGGFFIKIMSFFKKYGNFRRHTLL